MEVSKNEFASNHDFKGFSKPKIKKIICSFFKVNKVDLFPISGGLNNLITGGGLFKSTINPGPMALKRIIIKLVPGFEIEQASLSKVLSNNGHCELAKILSSYQSNNVGYREIESYHFLETQTIIHTPKIYFGIIEKSDGSALIAIEDISDWMLLSNVTDKDTLIEISKKIIEDLSKFHSYFYLRKNSLTSANWLGNWWIGRDSDYLSFKVAKYSIDFCKKFICDNSIINILENTLNNRSKIWDRYNNSKYNTLIHWDLNANNVLINSIGDNTVFSIIDWQTTSVGIPQWDLAQFLISLVDKLSISDIEELKNLYYKKFKSNLPKLDKNDFKKSDFDDLFNIVVVDYSFRSSINVLLANNDIDTDWTRCLKWIDYKKGMIETYIKSL